VLQLIGRGLALPGAEPKSFWVAKFERAYAQGYEARETKQAEQKATLRLDAPWAQALQVRTSVTGDVKLINSPLNAYTIMRYEGTYRFRWNVMDDAPEILADGEYRAFSDVDATTISNWLQASFQLSVDSGSVQEQVSVIAHEHEYDPVRSYLKRLTWDGVNRIDNFLVDSFGCEDTPLSRLYSRKWLIGLVARALRPGCKMDSVLVLKGAQGLGKSTGLQRLTEPWFSDSRVEIGQKDGYQILNSAWLHEFAELASMKRTDEATVKAFFTATQDRYRPSYGRNTITKPRRCIFVATTNEEEFLTDQSGNRRYWVVEVVRHIDFTAIEKAREMLFAEAVNYFELGESWHLDFNDSKIQRESAERYTLNPSSTKEESVVTWWKRLPVDRRPDSISTSTVLLDIWGLTVDKVNRSYEMEAGFVLRRLGWTKHRIAMDGRSSSYRPPIAWLQAPGLQEVKSA
jgi:putative DNA primase/helicase